MADHIGLKCGKIKSKLSFPNTRFLISQLIHFDSHKMY